MNLKLFVLAAVVAAGPASASAFAASAEPARLHAGFAAVRAAAESSPLPAVGHRAVPQPQPQAPAAPAPSLSLKGVPYGANVATFDSPINDESVQFVISDDKQMAQADYSLCSGALTGDDSPRCEHILFDFPQLTVDARTRTVRYNGAVVGTWRSGLFGGARLVAPYRLRLVPSTQRVGPRGHSYEARVVDVYLEG